MVALAISFLKIKETIVESQANASISYLKKLVDNTQADCQNITKQLDLDIKDPLEMLWKCNEVEITDAYKWSNSLRWQAERIRGLFYTIQNLTMVQNSMKEISIDVDICVNRVDSALEKINRTTCPDDQRQKIDDVINKARKNIDVCLGSNITTPRVV